LSGTGFLDVVAITHAWGSWRSSAVASQANELAAMPSLHIAWACWSSLSVWRMLAGRRWRFLVVVYPVMTALIVMATANHFFLDIVGGLATIAVAYGLAELLSGAARRPTVRGWLSAVHVRRVQIGDRLRWRSRNRASTPGSPT